MQVLDLFTIGAPGHKEVEGEGNCPCTEPVH